MNSCRGKKPTGGGPWVAPLGGLLGLEFEKEGDQRHNGQHLPLMAACSLPGHVPPLVLQVNLLNGSSGCMPRDSAGEE